MSNCAFNYSGSKSDYAELHVIDEPVVDLFGGGGGFWSMSRSLDVIVNDTNTQLVSFQKLVYEISDDNFEAMVSKLYDITGSVNSREEYEELRDRLNHMQNPVLFMAVLACCTNNMIRYNRSGGFNQTWGKRKFNSSMERKLRDFRDRIRCKNVEFMHGDFRLVPDFHDRLYFVDSPYLITSSGYNTSWSEGDEHDLYSYLTCKRFLLTNFITRGDMRNDILADEIKLHGWKYRVLREGKMRAQRDKNQSYVELLVADSEETMSKVFPK
jgi:site-specific DNA-adenine methylase